MDSLTIFGNFKSIIQWLSNVREIRAEGEFTDDVGHIDHYEGAQQ
jgi:hypothetical protein